VRLARAARSSKPPYSGMMPGWLAGRHRFDGCAIDLGRGAQAAGLEWIEDTIVTVDLRARQAAGSSGRRFPARLARWNDPIDIGCIERFR